MSQLETTDLLINKIKNCVRLASFCDNNNKKQNKLKPRSKWITKAIVTSCSKKELLYKIWKAEPNNQITKTEYKNYVKILNKVINEAKLRFDQEQVQLHSNSPRNLWKIINTKLVKNVKKRDNVNQLYDKDGKKPPIQLK